jgi:hypothetical protein
MWGIIVICMFVGFAQAQIPLSQMRNTTFLFPLACNTPTNQYTFTINNGYIVPVNFIVSLTCTNLPVVANTYNNLAALSSIQGQIGPTTGSIANRPCTIVLYTTSEPFTGTPFTYFSKSDSCGTANIADSGFQYCNYFNIPCRFSNAQWMYNAPCWIIGIYLPTVVIYIVITVGLILLQNQELALETRALEESRIQKGNNPLLKEHILQHYYAHDLKNIYDEAVEHPKISQGSIRTYENKNIFTEFGDMYRTMFFGKTSSARKDKENEYEMEEYVPDY